MAMAHAKEKSKTLAQTRGSVGTPEYMHNRVQEFEGRPGIKNIEYIVGEELKRLGMNMIYNVGQAAQAPPRAVFIHY